MYRLVLSVSVFFLIPALLVPVSSAKKCSDSSQLCVGLVTDVGVIDDKSFNQSTWEGLKLARQKLGAKIKYIETRDAKDYMANIALFVKNGYDVIVTVGYGLSEATIRAAKKYPNVKFIGVDQFQTTPLKNVAGLIFHEIKAGFLAGALAAMLSKTGTVSAVFGTDLVPPIVGLKKGYERGARYIKPGIKVISSYHPGGLDVAFTDPEWGASTARQAITQGADVVFGAGGLTGNGALTETASHKGKYCIGVDTNQWITLPAARPCLVSCALKRITPAIMDLIEKAARGTFPSGNYFGDIGLSSFHDFSDEIPQQIKDKLIEIEKGLKNKTITP
ncbi:MAG: BMP family ABC transporter substrate-binding protein [Deltaproteobacteria bacterium]|nr:BMP family ABC transporter substrate-binding protein [Deltaproteobacteria bacterium]